MYFLSFHFWCKIALVFFFKSLSNQCDDVAEALKLQLSGITPGGSLLFFHSAAISASPTSPGSACFTAGNICLICLITFTSPSVNSHLQAGEILVRLICVGRVTVPSSELDTGAGAGAERTGGGGIIFFLPGFSFLSISGAGREKDVAVSHQRKRG